jgi:uncharacterized protein (DUF885 family)
MTEFPEWATYNGYPGQNDRWTDLTFEAIARRKSRLDRVRKQLAAIDRSRLPADEQLNYDLFLHELELKREGRQFPDELLPVNQLDGIQRSAAELLTVSPAAKAKDYEDIIARLNALPRHVEQVTALMKEGLRRGITQPKITLRDLPEQLRKQTVEENNPLLEPFERAPEQLKAKALQVLREKVIPSFKAFEEFLSREYIPGCRETISISALPEGTRWYEFLARLHTTTDLSPRRIHEIGQAEVRRIRQEMETVIASTKFKGDFDEFLTFLRTDSRFFHDEPEELLRGYRDIAKRADPELAKLFGKLPRLPYGVLPVPAYSEKSQTTAYYLPGSPEAGRPGYFYANTYDLKARPKWEMEALTLHEAVPGHHLQIAIAQELQYVPDFRRFTMFTAFVEGWGLYSESLGGEMGFYKDPYSRFGQLTYEMWRAIRLVVDTGIHALGWTREQAIEFFKKNSSKTEHDIVVEVDRYIVWPGQALAYKIGELKIKELRAEASRKLGERFDIRAFHDTVLGNGAIPLNELEKTVTRWIRSQK